MFKVALQVLIGCAETVIVQQKETVQTTFIERNFITGKLLIVWIIEAVGI